MNNRLDLQLNRLTRIVAAFVLCAMLGAFSACNKQQPTAPSGGQGTAGESGSTRPAEHLTIKGVLEDLAVESGIDFEMKFLPGEQGEFFKVNLYDHGCGVVIGDYNGDGLDDVYFLNQLGRCALYRNKGDGTFVDATDEAGVGLGDRICVGASFADYDNDGDQDLFVTSTRGGNVLFQNDGRGHFTDVTKKAGVELVAHSATATFVDLDGDSWLDLIVTNTAKWTLDEFDEKQKYYPGIADYLEFASSPKEFNVVYHNNGDGTFRDVTESSGLAGKGWGGDVAAFDYDGDGRIDLVITNMFGASQLYRNQGNGTFTDVTAAVLGRISWGAIASKAFDFNNDGRLDLFITDMHSDMWCSPKVPATVQYGMQHPTEKYPYVTGPAYLVNPQSFEGAEKLMTDALKIQYTDVIFGSTFFKALPDGKFEEMSDKAGLETWWPWGIAAGDFDNDGYIDVYLPSGMGFPFGYWPSQLLMNNGDETFTEKGESLGVEPPKEGLTQPVKIRNVEPARSARCAAVADFDGDGRLDMVVNNFNSRPYYFRNFLPRRNFVSFRLQGVSCNRDAIGAVVRLYVGDEILTRQVHAAGGYLSQSSKTLHFGLGEHASVEKAEITWPGGMVQTLQAPAVNALHQVTQPPK